MVLPSYIIQMWTAVECNGAIYCTVVTPYCPRPKLLLKPSYFQIRHYTHSILVGYAASCGSDHLAWGGATEGILWRPLYRPHGAWRARWSWSCQLLSQQRAHCWAVNIAAAGVFFYFNCKNTRCVDRFSSEKVRERPQNRFDVGVGKGRVDAASRVRRGGGRCRRIFHPVVRHTGSAACCDDWRARRLENGVRPSPDVCDSTESRFWSRQKWGIESSLGIWTCEWTSVWHRNTRRWWWRAVIFLCTRTIETELKLQLLVHWNLN